MNSTEQNKLVSSYCMTVCNNMLLHKNQSPGLRKKAISKRESYEKHFGNILKDDNYPYFIRLWIKHFYDNKLNMLYSIK